MDFGNVNVEVAERIGLELAFAGRGAFHVEQPGQAQADISPAMAAGLALLAAVNNFHVADAGCKAPAVEEDQRPPEGGYSATEVMPGLWDLRSRRRACNAVLITGPGRTILVDTGLPSAYPSLVRAMADAGCQPANIGTVVLTHEHADHVGGAGLLPGTAEVLAHPCELPSSGCPNGHSGRDTTAGAPTRTRPGTDARLPASKGQATARQHNVVRHGQVETEEAQHAGRQSAA